MYVQEGIRFFQEGPCVFFEFREDICEREREDVDNMNLSEFFTENPQVAIAFSGVWIRLICSMRRCSAGQKCGLIM